MYYTVYLLWFHVVCCANVLFLVEEMSTSLFFTQQPLDQRTYLLRSWWLPPRLQEATMLKGNVKLQHRFGMGLFKMINFRVFFLHTVSLRATLNQHKKAKSRMTLPLVRQSHSYKLSYKLKTHFFKKCLKSASLNETFSLHIFHVGSH